MQPGHPKRFRYMRLAAPFMSALPLSAATVLRISGSDKENEQAHRYGETYQRLFRRFKYRRIKVLEIGIGGYNRSLGGESLAAWSCYFPFGTIIGCDIEDRRLLGGGRIRIHQLDQSRADHLATLVKNEGPFDIVIDDGSHRNDHQIFTFEALLPHIKPSGLYLVEDTQTSYWPEYGGKPVGSQDLTTCVGYFSTLASYLNYLDFRPGDQLDSGMLAKAQCIRRLHFEHNLIAAEII
jgi:hypothetical protein